MVLNNSVSNGICPREVRCVIGANQAEHSYFGEFLRKEVWSWVVDTYSATDRLTLLVFSSHCLGLQMPTLARRVRSSFAGPSSNGPPPPPPPPPHHPMLVLDFGSSAGASVPPPVQSTTTQPKVITKHPKKQDKFKYRVSQKAKRASVESRGLTSVVSDKVSLAIRKFGNTAPSSPPHKLHKTADKVRRPSASVESTPRARTGFDSVAPALQRSNSVGSRVALQVASKFSSGNARPGRDTTARGRASGSSPPLPPLPRQNSTDGLADGRALNRKSMLLSSAAFGPAFEVPDLNGLGLGIEQEIMTDFKPASRSSRMLQTAAARSASAHSSVDAKETAAREQVTPKSLSEEDVSLAAYMRTPTPPKIISFQRKDYETTLARPEISRPESSATLVITAPEGAAAGEDSDSELADLPAAVRRRVVDLRNRSSAAMSGDFSHTAIPTTKPLVIKPLVVKKSRSPTSDPAAGGALISAPRAESPAAQKPLPRPSEYVLRPTQHMATQTPDWSEPPRRPSKPMAGVRSNAAVTSRPISAVDWATTPPQAYATFGGPVASPPPPPPPPHSPPQIQIGSPSIYSYASTSVNPRRSSYYAVDPVPAWGSAAAGDNDGEQDVLLENVQEDHMTESASPSTESQGTPQTPVFARVQSSPTPPMKNQAQFRRPSLAMGVYQGSRISMPVEPTFTIDEEDEPKLRPRTVFNATYSPVSPDLHEIGQATKVYRQPASEPTLEPSVTSAISRPASSAYATPRALSPEPPTSRPQSLSNSNPFASPQSDRSSRTPADYAQSPTSSSQAEVIAEAVRSSTPTLVRSGSRRGSNLLKPAVPPRSAARGSPSRPVSMFVGDLSRMHSAAIPTSRDRDGDVSIQQASVVPLRNGNGNGNGHGIRRASLVKISPPSSRPMSIASRRSSASSRHSQDNNDVPAVPELPAALRQNSLPNLDVAASTFRRASEPSVLQVVQQQAYTRAAEPIPGAGGAVRRTQAVMSGADRASKGRSFFLVQALNAKPGESLKREWSGSDDESDLSSDDESVVEVAA